MYGSFPGQIDWYVGLNRRALPLLAATTRVEFRDWLHGRENHRLAVLMRYYQPDGSWYDEYVQGINQFEGLLYCIALKDKNGIPVPESLWTDQEIANT